MGYSPRTYYSLFCLLVKKHTFRVQVYSDSFHIIIALFFIPDSWATRLVSCQWNTLILISYKLRVKSLAKHSHNIFDSRRSRAVCNVFC